ncbi:VOC family protein [Flexibacterium corallicola]|uniref:VOC family protein n=1 Tax=Flexibacterium corallicola TaxID=3037259 RepID=UPI00286F0DFF|nr:VOC family protein [Pseudovibrio sp. M1P-2-3]
MDEFGNWKLDHIVVTARTLEEGAAHVKEQLGVDVPAGGEHPQMGTHNRVLTLGYRQYLEIIAIDPQAPAPEGARWFNLDQFDGEPTLSTWVIRSKDVKSDSDHAHPHSGEVHRMSRGRMEWLITITPDGLMPMEGAFPTLIEWPRGVHPTASMPDLGFRLLSLTIEHPQAQDLRELIGRRLNMSKIDIREGNEKKIRAEIVTPGGLRVLT